jgi:hypothetical protein
VSTSDGWRSTEASQPAFSTLRFELMARPSVPNLDGMVAIGGQDIGDFSDAAISVRFAEDGHVDARDGASYGSDALFPYEPGVWYDIVITADVEAQTYDVEVGRCDESREVLISGAAFRSDASASDRLTAWAVWSSQGDGLGVSVPTWIASGDCAAATCESLDLGCGQPSDGCDGTLSCGACGVEEVCSSGVCIDAPVSVPPPPGGGPSGPADSCALNAAISASCVCEGSEYVEGYCCDEGFSYSACSTTDVYALPGGSGRRDGSDWANALSGLPTSLVRDRVYWIGDGSYGTARRTFNTAESGSKGITIRKATAAEHGTETGWSATYGDGQATFGQLVFSTDRYTLDGGETNGIKTTVTSLIDGDLVFVNADYIVFRNLEMDGGTRQSGGNQTAGICSTLGVRGDYLVVDRCELHDAADDGVEMVGANNVKLVNSRIHGVHGCGTDGRCNGPCFNGHGDGIEMQSGTGNEITGNMIYDITGTGGMYIENEGGGPIVDLLVQNNIFYTPTTSLVVTVNDLRSPRFYNNVIWGTTDGPRYGGFSVGANVTDLEFYNNIITNIIFNHGAGTGYDPTQHHLDYNQFGVLATSEYPDGQAGGANNQVGNPLFDGIPLSSNPADHTPADLVLSEFSLTTQSPAIDQGTTMGPQSDIIGVSRPQGVAQDMGVFEVSGN